MKQVKGVVAMEQNVFLGYFLETWLVI